MQLFYNPDIAESTTEITFSKEESKHIVKVLRKGTGDVLNITNGNGWLFKAKLTIADMRHCIALITEKTFQEKRNYSIHLAVAPTKMNDRYEWFLEKATEIGVDSITPIICDHSERKVVKLERFEKILQAAMKQSLHYYLPELNSPVNFNDFVSTHKNEQLFIAHCEETDKKSLKQSIKPNTGITILIGPEGDFSTKEIQLALKNNFSPVALGNTRLRTETAAIVACHTAALINEI
ncbi:16S rRNA (uracil(1498)-N(3))-methyltransferase [Formosa sp. S-31]|uniref:16S rRNA (uracil(1498)-N(3))-methyltransferase n=1 Tax=Formosa sp. S-31 TaxID=2790949 RepID=UPI003EC0E649